MNAAEGNTSWKANVKTPPYTLSYRSSSTLGPISKRKGL